MHSSECCHYVLFTNENNEIKSPTKLWFYSIMSLASLIQWLLLVYILLIQVKCLIMLKFRLFYISLSQLGISNMTRLFPGATSNSFTKCKVILTNNKYPPNITEKRFSCFIAGFIDSLIKLLYERQCQIKTL